MNDRLLSLAQEAHAAYIAGNFDSAISTQMRLIAEQSRLDERSASSYLALAMYLFEYGKFPESLNWLQNAAQVWPKNSEIAENIGVLLSRLDRWKEATEELQRALKLGSKSHNILDCLCHCAGRLNDFTSVQHYGRKVLEAKNQSSLFAGKKYALPSRPPPRFDFTSRHQNVISYSLWGHNPRYVVPLLENLRLAPHLFPGWTIRVYVDGSVSKSTIDQLRTGGAQLVYKSVGPNIPFYARLLWRFEVANDASVQRFLIRDADSLLSVKERVAVDVWIASDTYFHVMRDFYSHTDLILAGMWGGVANVLPNIEQLWSEFRSVKMPGRTADQRFLGDMIWPTVSQSCLIHDSVFTGCLGSVPFPAFGILPPGHHIGQNAFIHFRKTRNSNVEETDSSQRSEGTLE